MSDEDVRLLEELLSKRVGDHYSVPVKERAALDSLTSELQKAREHGQCRGPMPRPGRLSRASGLIACVLHQGSPIPVIAAGADVGLTGSSHIRISKPGLQPVFTSSTPSDHRTLKNLRALLVREGYLTKEKTG